MLPVVLALAAALLGCGHTGHQTQPTRTAQPLELSLRASTGRPIDLVDYRGSVVLLAFLGTYDTHSQASLESLARFSRHHEEVYVVAILAQQGADLLVDAYANAANVHFPIAYCDDDALLAGETAVGPLEVVPTFVALDALGRPVARHDGYASERVLESLAEHARLAAPIPDRTDVPLLGQPH